MNPELEPMMEEINDNVITDSKPDKFIYRTKLLEILGRYLRFANLPGNDIGIPLYSSMRLPHKSLTVLPTMLVLSRLQKQAHQLLSLLGRQPNSRI